MTRAEILNIINTAPSNSSFRTTQSLIPLPFLPEQTFPISFEEGDLDIETIANVVERLCGTDQGIRLQIAESINKACQQSFADCSCDFDTPQAQLDWEAEDTGRFTAPREPKSSDDIWSLVKFKEIFVRSTLHGPNRDEPVAIISGDCAWDGEHGVALHFLRGETLVHIGGVND